MVFQAIYNTTSSAVNWVSSSLGLSDDVQQSDQVQLTAIKAQNLFNQAIDLMVNKGFIKQDISLKIKNQYIQLNTFERYIDHLKNEGSLKGKAAWFIKGCFLAAQGKISEEDFKKLQKNGYFSQVNFTQLSSLTSQNVCTQQPHCNGDITPHSNGTGNSPRSAAVPVAPQHNSNYSLGPIISQTTSTGSSPWEAVYSARPLYFLGSDDSQRSQNGTIPPASRISPSHSVNGSGNASSVVTDPFAVPASRTTTTTTTHIEQKISAQSRML